MARRRSMTPLRRARIFDAAGGICHICGQPIDGTREKWDADHVIALEISGDDSDANLAPAHETCHRGAGSKTSDDMTIIAKARRVRAKHIGAVKPKATLPGSRGSKWKRKIGGGIEPREQE